MSEEGRELTIEETFKELESVLERMETQEISLEESFACYEKGMKLVKYCNDKIDKVWTFSRRFHQA